MHLPTTTLALAALTPLASARRFLVLWEQINSLAGINDYPLWRIDTGDIDLCSTAPDCDWGDSEMTGSSYLYNGNPSYSRIVGKCDVPTIDIYQGDDGSQTPFIAGGDGSPAGSCNYNTDWQCHDPQAGGSVNRGVILICDLNV